MGWDAQFFVQKPRATRAFSKAKGKAQVRNKILLKQAIRHSRFAIRFDSDIKPSPVVQMA
jgi:hypothetical protein